MHPKKRTVGVRIPDHVLVQALLEALGEPLLTSTLILPGEDEPRTMGWEIKEELDHVVDVVIEAGETPARADHGRRLVATGCPRWCGAAPGDPARFEPERRRRHVGCATRCADAEAAPGRAA